MIVTSAPRAPDTPALPLRGSPPAVAGYVLIPAALIVDLADNLAAIGLYALIARRFLVRQAPVPLSASDVQRYDPALSRGAAVRALARLVQAGWLLEAASPGHKSAYTPTWGRIQEQARPWTFSAPRLGLPRRHRAHQLDRRLLDMYIGRLHEHPAHPAEVTRYLTRPLLTLADIGAYARASAGRDSETATLTRLGLVHSGHALPLPDDDALLALASQQALAPVGQAALSDRGLRRLGLTPASPAAHGQALFFVPAGVIGGDAGYVIGEVIGQAASPETPSSASQRAGAPPYGAADRSSAKEATQANASDPHPPSPCAERAVAGGGAGAFAQMPAADTHPSTPTADVLRSLGVRPSVIRELADTPHATVVAALAAASARSDVRDRAAWVVAAVRAARAQALTPDWSTTPPPEERAALDVPTLLARAAAPSAPVALPPDTAGCVCDGSGTYLLDVPYGDALWGKVQPCPCRHRASVAQALARAAGPVLAAVSLEALDVATRPYEELAWAGHTFAPAEQAATLRHALACAVAVAAAPTRGLTIVGPPGSGKTTLAVAGAKELATRHGLALRYASVPELCEALRREASEHAPATLLAQLIAAPVLVLDDLGRERLTPFVREQLYRLLDERLRRHSPDSPHVTFITSNRTFGELYASDPAIASRIAAHTDVTLCVAGDLRLRAAEEALP